MANLKPNAGTGLTEEVAEALADEAEAGYDLSSGRRVRRGRPSLDPSGVSSRVQIRVDAELAGALRDLAQKECRTVSEIGRDALRRYVDRN